MGLKKGPFVVAQTFSVLNPYGGTDAITLAADGDFEIVATVDVCVTQPQKTQVSLDSMAQIAIETQENPTTFEVTYEILRNGTAMATINNEMDYASPSLQRHTNFPNFPVLDNCPSAGINTYDLKITRVATSNVTNIFVASRSLKATVFEC
ncbi:hypothetical protein [Chengkuizengella marina]|uniref:Uncharacterized protein n=1 Tax=Chengkuizengella marina TaxID=2507566 RepID=A0A6N9Q0D8_9BACL|nr:hypothetical protein [Chengkuizengella marina]NBI28163.1 hypothetical protein [Chengkuizengella marina]